MAVYQNPVGLSTAPVANQLSELITCKCRLCKPICVTNSNQPTATVTYTTATPTLNGTTLFIPVTISVSLLSPSNCCNAIPQMFTETFIVAFQGVTALPTAVTVESVGIKQNLSCIKNGKAFGYVINDSITITITPAAA